MKRWTIKEMESTNTIDFIIQEMQERKDNLSNPYSPLTKKISKVMNSIKDIGSTLDNLTSELNMAIHPNWCNDKIPCRICSSIELVDKLQKLLNEKEN